MGTCTTQMWITFGGLAAAALGLVLFLVGANQTVTQVSHGGFDQNPINTLEIIGTALMSIGGGVFGIAGIIWIVCAIGSAGSRIKYTKGR